MGGFAHAALIATSARALCESAGQAQGVGCGDIVGPLAQRYWKAPFRYDAEGSMIWDARNERVLDVRGWGYLTGQGSKALGLSAGSAARIQDDFGSSVVALLNASWPNDGDVPRAGNSAAPKEKSNL